MPLVCISLMPNDAKHLFMCLMAIFMFSMNKYLVESFAHLKLNCFLIMELHEFLMCSGYVSYDT
jgi:hypothetical protein